MGVADGPRARVCRHFRDPVPHHAVLAGAPANTSLWTRDHSCASAIAGSRRQQTRAEFHGVAALLHIAGEDGRCPAHPVKSWDVRRHYGARPGEPLPLRMMQEPAVGLRVPIGALDPLPELAATNSPIGARPQEGQPAANYQGCQKPATRERDEAPWNKR